MNAGQIENSFRGDKFASQYFVGVFAADKIPDKEFPGGFVVSTDESGQPGQHLVAFFTVDNTIECFDSFGKNPGVYSVHIKKWLDDMYQVVQCETLQSEDSTVCGHYCMFFLLLRSYGFSYEDVMSAFTSDTVINDKFVCKFVNKFFKLKTSVQDKYFLIQRAIKK